MTAFTAQLAAAFHPLGLLVTQDVQTDSDAYDLPALARANDFLVPMLYDQHSDGTACRVRSPARTGSSRSWRAFWRRSPQTRSCWAWALTAMTGRTARRRPPTCRSSRRPRSPSRTGIGEDGVIHIDPASLSPYFTYSDEDAGGGQQGGLAHGLAPGRDHELESDARRPALPHAWAQPSGSWARRTPACGASSADSRPGRWRSFDPQRLSLLSYGKEFGTTFIGEGDVLEVVQAPTEGTRTITTG